MESSAIEQLIERAKIAALSCGAMVLDATLSYESKHFPIAAVDAEIFPELVEFIKPKLGHARDGVREPLNDAIRKAENLGALRITSYSYRHFMATKVRAVREFRVDREQRSLWLEHGKRDTTSWYEKHDPEHLRGCALATDIIFEKLDALTTRDMVPPLLKAQKRLTKPIAA